MLKFGTDGVRGVANAELTPELVVALGRAAARVLGGETFLIGRDTRVSGPLLQAALTAGLASEGTNVVDLGVLPTPAVAHASAARGVPGAMISASHNPFPDNGIKLFAAGGRKLSDETEKGLEAELTRLLERASEARAPTGADVGRTRADDAVGDHYVAHLLASLQGRSLEGLHVVLDCANGAASPIAGDVFTSAGARVEVISDGLDGTNINDRCGSTHPGSLQQRVRELRADAGLAFDGDADRVLAVDGNGDLVDGDHVIAICARDLRDRGRLRDDTVVVTVMTNLGFRLAMAEEKINVIETKVGDRYVLEALEERNLSLGGEQSGHVVFRDLATTGDGLLTGLQLLDAVRRSGRTLADLASTAMTRLPQVLLNVRVAARDKLDGAKELWDEVAEAEAALGDHGRVLLRPSGTEPLVRVMVEAPTEQLAQTTADRLAQTVERTLS